MHQLPVEPVLLHGLHRWFVLFICVHFLRAWWAKLEYISARQFQNTGQRQRLVALQQRSIFCTQLLKTRLHVQRTERICIYTLCTSFVVLFIVHA